MKRMRAGAGGGFGKDPDELALDAGGPARGHVDIESELKAECEAILRFVAQSRNLAAYPADYDRFAFAEEMATQAADFLERSEVGFAGTRLVAALDALQRIELCTAEIDAMRARLDSILDYMYRWKR